MRAAERSGPQLNITVTLVPLSTIVRSTIVLYSSPHPTKTRKYQKTNGFRSILLGNRKKTVPAVPTPLHRWVKSGGAKISMFSMFLLLSPSWHQLGSNMTPTWLKTAPRCPNIAPKMPQHGSKMGQHGSKMPQHVPKMLQHTPT